VRPGILHQRAAYYLWPPGNNEQESDLPSPSVPSFLMRMPRADVMIPYIHPTRAPGMPKAVAPAPASHASCPKCSMPMLLEMIEPLDEPGHERHVYKCLSCQERLNVVAKVD
jgi:hypothetical protein